MKIKRFYAADIRQALRQVRESLGSDAVILSNKPVDGGIELVAAIDYDESAFEPIAKPKPAADRQQPAERPARVTPLRAQLVDKPIDRLVTPRSTPRHAPKDASSKQTIPSQAQPSRPTAPVESTPSVEWSQDPAIVEMREEMKMLRRMMQNSLSELSWHDMGSHKPESQELYRNLMGLGLSADICDHLVSQVSHVETAEQAWKKALYFLAAEVQVAEADLLDQGGVVALIGPTGVGKTTTVAKLAARFALRHGHRQVALISSDSYRIGAQEQLNTYAKILDVPVRSADTPESLSEALSAFSDKRLVLIDTAGMGQKDVRLSEQLALLNVRGRHVRRFLTLSAATEQKAMEQTIKVFGKVAPEALILTKVDEAASLGGVFSAMIHTKTPVAFITDGQRVPEDIHVARPHTLVSRAVSASQDDGMSHSDEYLALALGGARVNAHG